MKHEAAVLIKQILLKPPYGGQFSLVTSPHATFSFSKASTGRRYSAERYNAETAAAAAAAAAAEVCGSVAAGKNFRRFERFRTFSNVLGVFDRFRTFSNVFERFRTFSSVSALPELGTISVDS